jgi:hypothetical protein
MSEGRLIKSVCHEGHIFKPFSSGDHGATTRQDQTLEFVSEAKAADASPGGGFETHFLSKNKNVSLFPSFSTAP